MQYAPVFTGNQESALLGPDMHTMLVHVHVHAFTILS